MVDQIRTLRGFASPNLLFVDFPSWVDFDDTYICDICTDSHLCLVCIEIEVSLQDDISSDFYYEIYTDKVDVADVNVAFAAKILTSIEQPPTLELKSIYVFLELFHLNLNLNRNKSCYKY